MQPTLGEAALLTAAALISGIVDAIAGGGGLITLPALLAAGLPPQLALGTNKGQAVFGSFTALARYAHAGLVDRGRAPVAFTLGLLGSLGGASLVLMLRPELLRPLVLVLLVLVALFLTLRRGLPRRTARISPGRARVVGWGAALLIGAYDGFFGPGTGTFLTIAFVLLLNESMSQATANSKVVNFASNLAAVGLFAYRGKVVWAYAVPMAAAQLVGGFVGAHLAVRVGDRLIRFVLLAVSLGLMAKVGYDLWGPG